MININLKCSNSLCEKLLFPLILQNAVIIHLKLSERYKGILDLIFQLIICLTNLICYIVHYGKLLVSTNAHIYLSVNFFHCNFFLDRN